MNRIRTALATSLLLVLATFADARKSLAASPELERWVLALLDDHRADEAFEVLRARKDPDPRLLGLVHHGAYRPDSVLAVLGPLHKAGEADDRVVLALAEAFLWKKDYRNAQALLDGFPRKEDLAYLRVQATQMELVNRHADALAIWDRVIARDPRPWGAMERKAIVLSWTKRFEESVALFSKVIDAPKASEPLRLRCRVRRAEVQAWNRDLDGALLGLRQILASRPDHAEAALLQGQVFEWQGRFPEAKATYTALLQKRPDHAGARLKLERLGWVE